MSQDNTNNYVISDVSGALVRQAINTTLQAIATNNSGGTPPAANDHQWFANTATNRLTYKDATTGNNANTNYFNLAKLDGGLFLDKPSTFETDVIFQGDNGSSSFQIVYDSSANSTKGALIVKDETRISIGTAEDFIMTRVLGIIFLAANSNSRVSISGGTTNASGIPVYEVRARPIGGGTLETCYEAYLNGGQHLFFDAAEKLKTTANGITVTGSVTTQDINMSNLDGSPNEVDNTKGSWSIQEGEDDLFLINKLNGKKYKFNVTEVT
tara:strand:- start:6497 stop:7303 length:807 start_codon:yes stop_codon:yes gene_type:complete